MNVTILALSCKGGMLHYASQLSNELSITQNVSVIIPKHTSSDLFRKEVHILKVKTAKSIKDYLLRSLDFRNLQLISNCIKQSKPDVLHIVSSHPWNVFFCSKKIPTIFTLHDPKKHIGEMILPLYWSDQYCKQASRKILVHGNCWKEYLIEKGFPSSKVTSVNHGDYSFFTKINSYNSLETTRSNVLFFGRIAKYKGIDILCKAEPIISSFIPDIKITIAGQGDTSIFSSHIVHDDKFEIIEKYIPEEEVPPLFEKSQLVILPYLDASQTGVIPIAYAFRKPVIATSVGAIPEIVENGITGFLVPPNDPEALAMAIVKALSDEKKLIEMGEAAFQKMREEFSWDIISGQITNCYYEITNGFSSKGIC